MARRKKTELPKAELNITSMMDLVLNLLMFFVLVSNFAMAEMPSLNPPQPQDSRAQTVEAPNKITVNILPEGDTGRAAMIKVGIEELSPGDLSALSALLQKEKAISEEVQIDLRADRSLTYDQVQPVMAAITNAGINRINVVAQMPE